MRVPNTKEKNPPALWTGTTRFHLALFIPHAMTEKTAHADNKPRPGS
jgi:hypothetical protein